MKYAIVFILICGCSTQDIRHPEIRDAFGTWQAAFVQGNFATIYALITDQCKSEWLFKMYYPRTVMGEQCYKKLPDLLIPHFDPWLRESITFANIHPRPPLLSDKILTSKWLYDTLKSSYDLHKENLKVEFQNMRLEGISKDGNDATIRVKNVKNEPELYTCTQLDGKWKIDGYILPPPK